MPGPTNKKPAVIGIPYEEGMYWRKGAKEGPAAIRKQLARLGPYSFLFGSEARWKIADVDRGDLAVDCYSSSRALAMIEAGILELAAQDRAPVVLGGDHSITLPVVRALARHLDPLSFGIIHLDAHSDTFDPVDGHKYHHGASIRNIVEEGLVDPKSVYQFGIRAQVWGKGLTFADESGIRYFSRDEFVARECRLERFGIPRNHAYYVSIDIDVVDPAFAPGTGTPVPAGLTSSEVLQVVRQLADLDVLGMDLVEVAPVYDPSEITSLLAANIVFEMLAGARWC